MIRVRRALHRYPATTTGPLSYGAHRDGVLEHIELAGWDVHHPFGGFRDSGSAFKEQGAPGPALLHQDQDHRSEVSVVAQARRTGQNTAVRHAW